MKTNLEVYNTSKEIVLTYKWENYVFVQMFYSVACAQKVIPFVPVSELPQSLSLIQNLM